MRGRKPHPTWRRTLDGNPGKRARNPHEPQPPAPGDAFDTPPPELDPFPLAQAEWTRIAPMLRRGRQVTEADRAALLALCLEWSRYLDAMSQVKSLLIMTKNGYPIPNPYIAIATKALRECRALWPELGLTPSSRTRLQLPPGDEDPFAEFETPPPLAAVK